MDATPQTGELALDECWRLLANTVTGRLALVVDGHPEIFPINFIVERRTIAFRTGAGTKLLELMEGAEAAIEIDGYDDRDEEAWSVVVKGTAALIESQGERSAVDTLGLEPWEPGSKSHYVRLAPRTVTGRRFKVAVPDLWSSRLNDRRRSSFE
ncbi:pyridoxamine 5'-phosphate oxidase family protein [Sinomonas gamaensis]|jgi:nitroimidazol reductase NimA-like FMN-containing flavoprotein (pyridoxamine 5'-phosphate oxidase superfamily)|uniref:pyridoxamine 5'-phosphate oxidase family protein n=1 Tax=Sinomonas gamaensis TaxID=2565624 RepID=UPI001108173A|nr:pyridoxamine 5'-phosphate oxidase family protein [Sinomonas gamaensis]